MKILTENYLKSLEKEILTENYSDLLIKCIVILEKNKANSKRRL